MPLDLIRKKKINRLLIHYSWIMIIASIIFLLFDLLVGVVQTIPIYCITIIAGLMCFFLLKKGFLRLAKHVAIVMPIIVVFIFSASDFKELGTYLLYFPLVVAAFTIFYKKDKIYAFGYTLIIIVLYIIAENFVLVHLDYQNLTTIEIKLNSLLNFSASLITAAVVISFLQRLNDESEIELKSSNQELDRFIYSASHDIRSPLRSTLGLLNLHQLSTNLEEKDQLSAMMELQIVNMDGLLKDIAEYSKNTKSTFTQDDFLLYEIIQETLTEIGYLHTDHVKIQMNFDKRLKLLTDKIRLKTVLRNLISNGIKYSDLNKAHPKVIISVKKNSKEARISINDNGIGIAPEHSEKVFDMFYRASHSGVEGSGLGLYIVSETLRKMGGTITLKSDLGQGSTFEIVLPQND